MNFMPSKILTTIAICATSAATCAAVFEGVIEDADGQPLAGVLTRFTNDATGVSESVYSDKSGRFRLQTDHRLASSL